MAKQLSALYINCSLEKEAHKSHTRRLINRSAGILKKEGVAIEVLHARDYKIAFGMVKDASEQGLEDDWPVIQKKIMAADIVVIGSPIWLGVKASLATLVIERMYAYSGETNEKGQYLYYGKTGGVITTGNEDGAKACAMDMLYALSHIGFAIPPQADCTWLGEAGPGPSYGDVEFRGKQLDPDNPEGYNNDFTNKNATIMSWNLMHMATMLGNTDGWPAIGNVGKSWQSATNAADQDPENL